MRRRRTKRKLFLIVFGVLVVLLVSATVWYHVELRPANAAGKSQLFNVNLGETTPEIAIDLHAADLIRSKDAFITYLGIHGLRGRLKAGVFRISPAQTAPQIADILSANGPSARELTVIPGDTLTQIEALAAEEGISEASFVAALAAPHTETILNSKPADVSLEGYLYPDTYALGPNVTADQLVDTMITDLANHIPADVPVKLAAEGLTLHQGLTLASIVEREVSDPSDQAKVAQVFLSRLKLGMPLGSDVTAIYASDLAGVPFSTTIQSPYNTLINTGLPPGPICSPSLSALEAAANPADTDYLYFLTGKDGKTYYAQTYAEHEANIAKYLN